MAPLLRARLDESRGLTPADYDAAIRIASRARHALAKVFEEVDVLLTLSALLSAAYKTPAGKVTVGGSYQYTVAFATNYLATSEYVLAADQALLDERARLFPQGLGVVRETRLREPIGDQPVHQHPDRPAVPLHPALFLHPVPRYTASD